MEIESVDSEEEKFQEMLEKVPLQVFCKFETDLDEKYKITQDAMTI